MTEQKSIGIAVVGAGYWGPNLVRNAAATPALRLEYLCDLDTERARTVLGAYSTVRVSGSLDEVLADPAVDAVAVATPAATHLPVAMAALRAGKHVLVEKPLAATVSDGRALVDEAQARGLVLMLDHTYCYTPAVQRLRELVRGGEIGSVQYLDSVRINLGLVQPDVDVLWDLAPHDLSIFLSILPDDIVPVSVAAHGSDPIGAGRACVGHLTLELSNGAMAHVHVNWLSPTKIRTMVIGGSERTVVWDDLNLLQRLAVHDRGVERKGAIDLGPEERTRAIISYRTGDMVAPALPEREALRAVMAEFAASIGERRAPLTDGWAGLRVLTILEAASKSLASGGVFVDVEQEHMVGGAVA
ncbi:putative dehydrogenase [Herbihabitans rhizosphaerae]|uniref:Putative dehydrogenase n=1 Tax=Herbihabitans rhizosphaerae TaxID=1872711 RepID=A0A4Q7KZ18_9PSEU|nr:Gfo/Idh/MocA family oxidoreductase [Herbihabitans rhizosphaerae]RZS40932.1 putative dehydrogenase [Herbihabitans rhizosphaerae]